MRKQCEFLQREPWVWEHVDLSAEDQRQAYKFPPRFQYSATRFSLQFHSHVKHNNGRQYSRRYTDISFCFTTLSFVTAFGYRRKHRVRQSPSPRDSLQ